MARIRRRYILKDQGKTVQLLEQVLGKGITHQLVTAEHRFAAGNQRTQLRKLLSQPAFTKPMPPPLPQKIRELHQKGGVQAIAEHFNVEAAQMPNLNLKSYATVPRSRCVGVDYPEWQMIIDSPDITFYVTQNINGADQTIYSDSYFDIGWESGSPGDVILHASSNALALTTSCVGPVINSNGQVGIQYVGLVPAIDEYIAQATGYARRTNRPIPDADASSPLFSTLWLYGLTNYPDTAFYRIKYPAGGTTFTFIRDTLILLHKDSTTQSIIPDADGWYPVHSDAGLEGPYTSLLVQWQTSGNATYDLQLELADATKTVIWPPTPINPLRIAVDDTAPLIQLISLYSYLDGDTVHKENLGFICPLVRRSPGQDIYLELNFQATAAHLYDVQLTSGGCGAGDITLLTVIPAPPNLPWPIVTDLSGNTSATYHYKSDGDDNASATATFKIPSTDAEGSYTMYITAYSRAFNPSDPNGPLAPAKPWQTTSLWVRSDFYLPVSIVNS